MRGGKWCAQPCRARTLKRRLRPWVLFVVAGCAGELSGEPEPREEARDAASSSAPSETEIDGGRDAASQLRDAVTVSSSDAAADAAADAARDAGRAQPDANTDAAEPVESFAAIYSEILQPRCAISYCHVATNRGGLNMAPRSEAYRRLYNQPAGALERDPYSLCKESGMTRVVPGDPEASLLIQKLAPPDGVVPCGKAMPEFKAPLPDEEIARLRRWIAQGAPNN